ncbi:MAG TPA: cupin domain-containing protein [Bryobacterales bacterium]|nr:cupin domain-containing protein [Bryobacterales bacterium]
MSTLILRTAFVGGVIALSFGLLDAQSRVGGRPPEEPSYFPKPVKLTAYTPPMKPHTVLAEVKAKHKGQKEWSEWVVKDDYLWGQYIQSAPGSKVSPRFHPDTRAWWVILEGQIRFNIEGQESFVARRRTMAQVPAQTIYSMETVGDEPAIRFEVGIHNATTLYPEKPTFQVPGANWVAVKLNRHPFPWGHENKPHINLDDLVAANPNYNGSRFVWDDRAVANIIYGYSSKLPPVNPKDKGHFHPECAEFWVIMEGQIRYPIEGQSKVVIANEGDVVYVPKWTYHAPRWWGDGPSCRLAMNGYPDIAHLRDAFQPH